MKKTFAMLVIAASAAGSTAAAHADVGVVGEVGTTGVGGHAVIPLRPNVNARVGFGYFNYSYSGSTSDMKYDLSMKSRTYDALLDWYPRKESAFHVTAGVAYNGNKIDVAGRPHDGNYTINGNTYDAASAGKVTGSAGFNKLAPYLGVGWSKSAKDDKGWSFSSDVGLLFQGSPHTTLANSGCSASAAVCGQLAADVAKEKARLAGEVSRSRVYPVLRVGVSYKF